jgi:hypothetical protein
MGGIYSMHGRDEKYLNFSGKTGGKRSGRRREHNIVTDFKK